MRPYHKKWKTARELFVFFRKDFKYISYHLRIPEDVLQRWHSRFNWDEMRATIDMRPTNIANAYLHEAEYILNSAHHFNRNLQTYDLKKLDYLNRGIAACSKTISLPKQAEVLEQYLHSLNLKPHMVLQIRSTVLDYLQQEMQAHRQRTTVTGLIADLKQKVA
jgi:hypothetical protein